MEELDEKILEEINVAAYFLKKENFPFDGLCWILAERRLMYRNPESDFTEEQVKHDAAANFFSCCDYDVMVWLISELDILLKYELYGRDI